MDGIHENEPGLMHYLQGGDAVDQDDNGDHDNMGTSDGVNEVMDGDVADASMGNQCNNHDGGLVPISVSENTNQLTLSFQGQVYVFDSVSPEKVQAVLLLLGGREVPSNIPAAPLSILNTRGASSIPQKLNLPQRMASLVRFYEKRKERNFNKKIRYTVRKEVALRMQRNKGQFTSSQPTHDYSASNWDSNPSWSSDGNGSQFQDISYQLPALCGQCQEYSNDAPWSRRTKDSLQCMWTYVGK